MPLLRSSALRFVREGVGGTRRLETDALLGHARGKLGLRRVVRRARIAPCLDQRWVEPVANTRRYYCRQQCNARAHAAETRAARAARALGCCVVGGGLSHAAATSWCCPIAGTIGGVEGRRRHIARELQLHARELVSSSTCCSAPPTIKRSNGLWPTTITRPPSRLPRDTLRACGAPRGLAALAARPQAARWQRAPPPQSAL